MDFRPRCTSEPDSGPAMPKPSFLFPTKLRRGQYLVRWLIWLVAFGGSVALLVPLAKPTDLLILGAFVIALTYKILALDIPRLKDAGLSPFLLLLLIVPVANLVIVILLFFARSKPNTDAPPELPATGKTPVFETKTLRIFGVLAAIGIAALLVLGLLIQAGILPDTAVLRGNELSPTARGDLYEIGVLQETENVLFFYSGGFLSIKEDGNFFTESRVVSYSLVDEEFWLGEARFEEIEEIKFEKKQGFAADSIITIYPKTGEGFYLVVSNEDDKDEDFYAALESAWKLKRN